MIGQPSVSRTWSWALLALSACVGGTPTTQEPPSPRPTPASEPTIAAAAPTADPSEPPASSATAMPEATGVPNSQPAPTGGPMVVGAPPPEPFTPPSLPACQPSAEMRLALALVVDTSGSMTGAPIIALQGAVKDAAAALRADDVATLIAFDSAPRAVVPLGAKSKLVAGADALRPGGGTVGLPALELAYRALHAAPANRRHVVFMTDGKMATRGMVELVQALRSCDTTVTTVGLGEVDATLLTQMAHAGEGQALLLSSPGDLSATLTNEVARVKKAASAP